MIARVCCLDSEYIPQGLRRRARAAALCCPPLLAHPPFAVPVAASSSPPAPHLPSASNHISHGPESHESDKGASWLQRSAAIGAARVTNTVPAHRGKHTHTHTPHAQPSTQVPTPATRHDTTHTQSACDARLAGSPSCGAAGSCSRSGLRQASAAPHLRAAAPRVSALNKWT